MTKLVEMMQAGELVPFMERFRVGECYSSLDMPGLTVCTYKLEWLDRSPQSHGVALWRNERGILHLQNITDFQPPPLGANL